MAQTTKKQTLTASVNVNQSELTGKIFGILEPADSDAEVVDFYDFKVSVLLNMTLACDKHGKVIKINDLRYVKSFNPSNPIRIE